MITLDFTEPRPKKAKALRSHWKSAFDPKGWPTASALGEITTVLCDVILPMTGWKRNHDLIDVVQWADARWKRMGLCKTLQGFVENRLRSCQKPLLSTLAEMKMNGDAVVVVPGKIIQSVYPDLPRMDRLDWRGVLTFVPATVVPALTLRGSEARTLFHFLELRGYVLKAPSRDEVEQVAKKSLNDRLRHDKESLGGAAPFIDWLFEIRHFELLDKLERTLFWPGALGVDDLKRDRERERWRVSKARQRAK